MAKSHAGESEARVPLYLLARTAGSEGSLERNSRHSFTFLLVLLSLLLNWFRPIQMLVQKINSALAVDGMAAIEKLDLRPLSPPKLVVHLAYLSVLRSHPFVGSNAIEVAALDSMSHSECT